MQWIAELGSNHKGSASLAFRMVKAAAQSGATIIKFQAGRDPRDPIRYADPFLPDAFNWCKSFGVEFLASCWSHDGLRLMQNLGVARRKIAHQQSDADNTLAADTLAESLPTFISVDPYTGSGKRFFVMHGGNKNITWLHVNSMYPTYFPKIENVYPKGWGYSDHTHGIEAPLIAVAYGARTIECHFTLDPTEETIKDNHFACTPDEFLTMVRLGNEMARLGDMGGDNFRSANWG